MRMLGVLCSGATCALAVVASIAQSASTVRDDASITVHRHRTPAWVLDDRRTTLGESQYPIPGFRARILQDDVARFDFDPWSPVLPGAPRSHPEWKSADLVSRRLARDGLLMTLANVLAIWHAPEARGYETPFANDKVKWLRGSGLPVDLLPFFALDGEQVDADKLVQHIENRLASGATPESLKDELARIPFRFRPSAAGFRAASESGEDDVSLVRVQLTSGTYWSGAGDGGCLDVVRQTLSALPNASFFASIEEKHLERFLETARSWPIGRADRFTVSPEPLPVSQWAQDDGKPGTIAIDDSGKRALATLVPRYASRGEPGASFVPGETYLIDGFAAAGQRVVQSPLLFQGGNLLVVREPVHGTRILFVGEAEIHRNTSLGLTREQVLDAFKIELGVERTVVLPAVSFHIDCELCARAVGDRLVAFVDDTPAAARIVFECGLEALEQHGEIDPVLAREARASLAAGRIAAAVESVSGALVPHLVGPGRFAEAFSRSFAAAAWDSGAGNLETFLLALDLLQSETVRARSLDPNTSEYLASLERRERDRAELVSALVQSGCEIVRVPSFSDGDRGINYVNGVHTRDAYLMPAHAGLYAPLDRAAQFAFEAALGADVKVLPIATSESQRRSGAVHCSISVYPRL